MPCYFPLRILTQTCLHVCTPGFMLHILPLACLHGTQDLVNSHGYYMCQICVVIIVMQRLQFLFYT